ncbi:uncharacterized protein LOC119667225 [Teleopsis dalmanni]|uniref:uncharacterized protein LOC119667225 n=1 Tax=Teleopsis dalmanni TaxID=139649 RepID=UPI0018CDE49E|nr:uncharacterized protein LOC119667225 [Teleopsis dalmanni]
MVAILSAQSIPAPEPEPVRECYFKQGRQSSYANEQINHKVRVVGPGSSSDDDAHIIAELRQASDTSDVNEDNVESSAEKADGSSGRLFLKKFLLFRNIFGNSNQQPVIPIIITGATGTTGNVSPTSTVTSTGTIPSATGTITTTPITTTATRMIRSGYNEDEENDAPEEIIMNDEQTLQAALTAGAQEYVVTDEEIKGTSDSKGTKQPARINLRRKGAKKGQVISVRIPPQYRRYFKNGQRVMLNTNNRPVKRRVVKKRVNNKNRRKINKRTRVVAA